MWVVATDVLDGMKEMFTRTQFAVDQGGYFPEIKVLYDPVAESNCSLSVQVSPGTPDAHPFSLYRRFQALGFECTPTRYPRSSLLSLPGAQN